MSLRITIATARRVLTQLRRDPRTVALLLVVPAVLVTLLKWVFHGTPQTFHRVGAPLLGIFPFVTMFLVTSITTLRERTTGTLERLLTMPLHKLDLLLGYAIAFGAVALVQVGLASWLVLGPLGLHIAGHAWLVFLVAVLDALLGMALGLFVSAFAATEFQAVQFMPAIVFPQLLLCGLFAPRGQMSAALHWVSDALPLSYAVDALLHVTTSSRVTATLVLDMGMVAAVTGLSLVLGAATLRRRTG